MEDKKLHYRHIMLYCFKKKISAVKTAKRICDVYGKEALSARTVCKWFGRFRSGNFELEDDHRSGRPATVDDKRILELIEEHPEYSCRRIAEVLQVSHASVKRHLQLMNFSCNTKRKKAEEQ